MLFDYSCCDFCCNDESACESCQAKAAERRLNAMMADLMENDDHE